MSSPAGRGLRPPAVVAADVRAVANVRAAAGADPAAGPVAAGVDVTAIEDRAARDRVTEPAAAPGITPGILTKIERGFISLSYNRRIWLVDEEFLTPLSRSFAVFRTAA
jgi:hypothetical protein